MKFNLLPCPFCGGKPMIEGNHRGFVNGESARIAFVRCSKCNARSERIPVSKYGCTSYSIEAVREAVNSWNRRAASMIQNGLVEYIKDQLDYLKYDEIKNPEYVKGTYDTLCDLLKYIDQNNKINFKDELNYFFAKDEETVLK